VASPAHTADGLQNDLERIQAVYEEATAAFFSVIDEIGSALPLSDLPIRLKEASERFKETRGAYTKALRRFHKACPQR